MIYYWQGQEGAYTLECIPQDWRAPAVEVTGPTHEACIRELGEAVPGAWPETLGYHPAQAPERQLAILPRGYTIRHRRVPRHFAEPLLQFCDMVLMEAAWTPEGQRCPCGDIVWHAESAG